MRVRDPCLKIRDQDLSVLSVPSPRLNQNLERETRGRGGGGGALGYSKVMFLLFVLYHLMLSVNFNDYEIRHGIFLVLHFSPGIILGF